MPTRHRHFRFHVTKDKAAGDSAQIPAASVTVDVYRQGGYVESGIAGLLDATSGNITFRDLPRGLAVSDTLFRLDASPVDTTKRILVNTITEATRVVNITNQTGATLTISAGERWTPFNAKPSLFNEGTLTNPVSLPLLTGGRGEADCYTAEHVVDYTESGGVTATGYPDHGGEEDNVWLLLVRDVASVVAGTIQTLATLTQGTILRVLNNLTEKWRLDFDGSTTQQGKLTVAAGGAAITGTTTVTGATTITGNQVVTGTQNVQGAADFDSTLNIDAEAKLQTFAEFTEIVAPATPAANKIRVFADTADNQLKSKRDDGILRKLDSNWEGSILLAEWKDADFLDASTLDTTYADVQTSAPWGIRTINFGNGVGSIYFEGVLNMSGAGTNVSLRITENGVPANILVEGLAVFLSAAGDVRGVSGSVALPGWAVGSKSIEVQMKEDTGTAATFSLRTLHLYVVPV